MVTEKVQKEANGFGDARRGSGNPGPFPCRGFGSRAPVAGGSGFPAPEASQPRRLVSPAPGAGRPGKVGWLFSKSFSLLGGMNFRREAPRALALDHITDNNVLQPETNNNLTLNFYSPFVSADGTVLRLIHYNLGYRRDEVSFENQDLYRRNLSFSRHASINSPKGDYASLASLIIVPADRVVELRAVVSRK